MPQFISHIIHDTVFVVSNSTQTYFICTAQIYTVHLLCQNKQHHYWTTFYCPSAQPTKAAHTLRTLCLLLLEMVAAHNQTVSSQIASEHQALGTLFWVFCTRNKTQYKNKADTHMYLHTHPHKYAYACMHTGIRNTYIIFLHAHTEMFTYYDDIFYCL